MSERGKRLAYLLRHAPSEEIARDARGWAPIAAVLDALARAELPTTEAELRSVVASDPKGRFAIEGECIRARQGHSRPVELDLSPATPPERLFHGTSRRSLASIQREGLRRGQRHHVHLSATEEEARQVAKRRREPVVLAVDAGALHRRGVRFLRSDNGVWLVDAVPPDALLPVR